MAKNKNLPLGENWQDYRDTLLTPEERAEIDLKVSLVTEIINARRELGLTQKQLEVLSGVRQPVIARLEKGQTDPQLTTIMKILAPLGKTIAIVPLKNTCPDAR